MRYRFARCELDADRRTLERAGERVELQPKVFAVLLHLLRHADRAVDKDELLDAVWPGIATTEGSLTRAISLARRAVGEEADGTPVIATVWGHGYRIGVPVERMDEPTPGPPAPARSRQRGRASRRRGLAVAAVATLLGLVALGWPPGPTSAPPALPPAPPTPAGASLAVLPFADFSPDGDQAYLGDGLAEEILHALTRLPGLRVVARTSSFALRDRGLDAREIAARLGVSAVLEGSVRREGERVRVTAQLIDGHTGQHLWSRTYDREAADVFALQEEIAAAILDSIRVEVAGDLALWARHRRHPSLPAYELYLRARQAAALQTDAAQREAIAHLERALARAPDYAEAYALLATADKTLWGNGATEPAGDLLQRAEAAARRAVALDPYSAEAHTALGDVLAGRRQWEPAEAAYRRALELNPGYADAHFLLADLLMMRGRLEEARPFAERALALDPLSSKMHRGLGRLHFYAGEDERAIAVLRDGLEVNPDDPHIPRLLAAAYERAGRPSAAREVFLGLVPPLLRPLLRASDRLLGRERSLRLALRLDALRTGDPCRHEPYFTALMLAHLGSADRMYACLERAADRHLWYVRVEPDFDPYRADPRFESLLQRSGFANAPPAVDGGAAERRAGA